MPRFSLAAGKDTYEALHDDGRVQPLQRVTHILQAAGLSPRYGKNALLAAGRGTSLHDLIRNFLDTGREGPCEDDAMLNCWALWKGWWEAQMGLIRPVWREHCVGCQRLGYGGMLDLYAAGPYGPELFEWKTGSNRTADNTMSVENRRAYKLQLAAYALALEEMGHPLPVRARVVRVGKTDAEPEVVTVWSSIEQARALMVAWEHVVHLVFSLNYALQLA